MVKLDLFSDTRSSRGFSIAGSIIRKKIVLVLFTMLLPPTSAVTDGLSGFSHCDSASYPQEWSWQVLNSTPSPSVPKGSGDTALATHLQTGSDNKLV